MDVPTCSCSVVEIEDRSQPFEKRHTDHPLTTHGDRAAEAD